MNGRTVTLCLCLTGLSIILDRIAFLRWWCYCDCDCDCAAVLHASKVYFFFGMLSVFGLLLLLLVLSTKDIDDTLDIFPPCRISKPIVVKLSNEFRVMLC